MMENALENGVNMYGVFCYMMGAPLVADCYVLRGYYEIALQRIERYMLYWKSDATPGSLSPTEMFRLKAICLQKIMERENLINQKSLLEIDSNLNSAIESAREKTFLLAELKAWVLRVQLISKYSTFFENDTCQKLGVLDFGSEEREENFQNEFLNVYVNELERVFNSIPKSEISPCLEEAVALLAIYRPQSFSIGEEVIELNY